MSVKMAELSMERRLGASEDAILCVKGNIASNYQVLHRFDECLSLRREVYLGYLSLNGEDYVGTIAAANNYASTLVKINRYAEAKSLLRKTMPVARRALGEHHESTFKMTWSYAVALFLDADATLDDLREAVTTLEETTRTMRRVLGGTHPLTGEVGRALVGARVVLRSREALEASQPTGNLAEEVD